MPTMRLFLQQHPSAGKKPRYLQLTLQSDLLGNWELLRESGLVGGRSQLRREHYPTQSEAIAALEKSRDLHLKRGFQLIPTSDTATGEDE